MREGLKCHKNLCTTIAKEQGLYTKLTIYEN